ncbi:helix-turn-helix transcriptional regulator [Micromonospora sp. NPDC005173]|uniref:helix-turn-helix transcriptional regulator n=1 Tax=Micromonospora sp. NPDC005173 TaxID=3157165 RepID=UPI0033B0C7F6
MRVTMARWTRRKPVSSLDEEPDTTGAWAATGLSEFDEALYVQILQQPHLRSAGWARVLGASEAAVRRGSDRLAEVGLLRRSDSTDTLRAVDPRLAARALIREREAESDQLAAAAAQVAETFEQNRLQSVPSRLVEVVRGEDASAARLRELYARAEHDLCGFDAPPYLVPTDLNSDLQTELLIRGLVCRTVYDNGAFAHPEMLSWARHMRPLGEQARVLPAVPLKLLLFDGRTAILPLTRGESGAEQSVVIVRESALTDALQALFEALWRQATPLWDDADTHPEGTEQAELTEAEQTLVRLLAVGMKDEDIARHLDISVRTLRRRISDLQTRLGAGGRFQAGVQAARRGWT